MSSSRSNHAEDGQLKSLLSLIRRYAAPSSFSIPSSPSWHTRLPVPIEPPFDMPADVSGLESALKRVSMLNDLGERVQAQLAQELVANFCSALAAGRACNRVTIMLFGKTGQGKSATINKLVGRRIFETGRDQSTTKDIISATIYATNNGVRIPVGFDDTPGLQDTQVGDRARNAVKLRRYREFFNSTTNSSKIEGLYRLLDANDQDTLKFGLQGALRGEMYPNAILLTAKWENVQDEGSNSRDQLTSAMGVTVHALHESRLYDQDRPNVIVLVTKAIFSPRGDLGRHFEAGWAEEAGKKRRFIHHIQKLFFPTALQWPVVFVENGGDPDSFGTYEFFPGNTEQSHQNLFEELKRLFGRPDPRTGARDLLGLQALATVIAGDGPYIKGEVQIATLENGRWASSRAPALDMNSHQSSSYLSPVLQAMASSIIGWTFDPIGQSIGRNACAPTGTQFLVAEESDKLELIYQSSEDEVHGPCTCYSASASAASGTRLKAYSVAAVATLSGALQPSAALRRLVENLPEWDKTSLPALTRYQEFFSQNGTHIVTAAAMGGRITVTASTRLHTFDVYRVMTVLNCDPRRPSRRGFETVDQLEISIDGGRGSIIEGSLAEALQMRYSSSQPGERWRRDRSSWVDSLPQGSVFLPDAPDTKYMWLYHLEGFTLKQREDLRRAAIWYLSPAKSPPRSPVRTPGYSPRPIQPPASRTSSWSAIPSQPTSGPSSSLPLVQPSQHVARGNSSQRSTATSSTSDLPRSQNAARAEKAVADGQQSFWAAASANAVGGLILNVVTALVQTTALGAACVIS